MDVWSQLYNELFMLIGEVYNDELLEKLNYEDIID